MAQTARFFLILFTAATAAVFLLQAQPRRVLYDGGCGPRALHAVMTALGAPVDEARVFQKIPERGHDANFAELHHAARQMGFVVQARKMTLEQLQAEKPLGVLHVDGTHFVALVGYDEQAAHIVDRMYEGEKYRKPVRWSYGDVQARWDGRILILKRRVP